VDVLPIFRLLYAQVAASCNGLAHAIELRQGLKFVRWSPVATAISHRASQAGPKEIINRRTL